MYSHGFAFEDFHKLPSEIDDPGPLKTYATGFPMLDADGLKLHQGAFMTIMGPYGSGKSVIARQLACNMYQGHGWRTLLTSFEERFKPRMMRDLRRFIGINNRGVMYSKAAEDDRIDPRVDDIIDDAFGVLGKPDGAIIDQPTLSGLIAEAIKRHDYDMVVIDPVNEIDHEIPRGVSLTQYMAKFIMDLKSLALWHDVLIVLVAHPSKANNLNRSNGHLFTLNDVSDTAHFGNKSDFGWCVWRPSSVAPSTFLNIDKIKDQEMCGKPGFYELQVAGGAFVTKSRGRDAMEALSEQTD